MRPIIRTIILCCVIFFPFIVSAQTDTAYTDQLGTNWNDDSWGGNNNSIASTTNPYSGIKCVEIEYTDWGYFGFDHRDADWTQRYYYYTNQYKNVNFYYNPGSDPSQTTKMSITLDLGKEVAIKDYISGTLEANTWYHVRIPIADMDPDNKPFFRLYFGNPSSTLHPHIYIDQILFEYVSDSQAPVISNVTASDIEQDAATISWKTDESVKYTFKYRVQGSGGNYTSINTSEYGPNGTVDLTGLTTSTNYEYSIICSDHQRDQSTPSNTSTYDGTFSTTAADVTAPVVSNLRVIDVYSNRVVIGWNTNEPSTTVLNYGEGDYNTTYTDNLYTSMHTVVLTHIKTSTVYQYKVSSTDRLGNKSEIVETPAKTFTTTAKTTGTGKYIIADHPLYQWDDVGPSEVPWKKITHLNLGQLWPATSDSGYTLDMGNYTWWGTLAKWKTEAVKYITSGHNANRKVICMLGGADSNPDGRWNTATSSANVAAFAENIVKTLKPMGFDGLVIDWEGNSDYDLDYTSLIQLVKELRKDWPESHIDLPTGMNGDDAVNYAPIKDEATTFSPMSYMAIPQWGGFLLPIPISPLYTVSENNYGTDYTIKKFKDAGISLDKVVVGVGGFGEIWGDTDGNGFAPVRPYISTGSPNGESRPMGDDNLVTWSFVRKTLTDNPAKLYEAWDELGQSAYWHTEDSSKQIKVLYPGRNYYLNISLIFYETARSMSKKVEYVESSNVKGIGSWTLAQLIDQGSSPVLDVASCMELDTTSNATRVYKKLNSSSKIIMYPDPVSDFLNVNNVDINDELVLNITDCLGRTISEEKLTSTDNLIYVQGKPGVYFVLLKNKSGIVDTRKIVKK